MDSDPSDDQRSLQDAVRKFARAELAPGYLARAQSDAFPWELHRRVASLGTFGLLAGPDHNPLGHEDHVAVGLVVEELAYADFNIANAAIAVMLMSSLIEHHGTEQVRRDWLDPLVAGEAYMALGLTEPETGSDVTAIRTTAVADGDGYVISGEKTRATSLARR